ncbi:MAG: hypothetical protein V4490_07390 [Pseudomonadota bacterium]
MNKRKPSRGWFFPLCVSLMCADLCADAASDQLLNNVAQAKSQYQITYMPPNPTNFLTNYLNGHLPAWGANDNDAVTANAAMNTKAPGGTPTTNNAVSNALPPAGTAAPGTTGSAYNWVQ